MIHKKEKKNKGRSGGSLLTYIPPPPFILPPCMAYRWRCGRNCVNFTCKLLDQLARSISLITKNMIHDVFIFYLGRLVFGYRISWSGFWKRRADGGTTRGCHPMYDRRMQQATHTAYKAQQACSRHAAFTAQRFVCSVRLDELPANALD